MPSVKVPVFLVILSFVILAQADNYSNGFVDTLGIDAHIGPSGLDCNEILLPAVHTLKAVLEKEFEKVDTFSTGVVSFIDTVLFQMDSECKFFYGDFHDFFYHFSGDQKALKQTIEKNREAFKTTLQNELLQATQELVSDRKYNAGAIHAQVVKVLIGIGKTFRDTEGSWIDGVHYVDSSTEIELDFGESWQEKQLDEIVVEVHHQPLSEDSMDLIRDLTVTSLHGNRLMMEL